MFSTIETAARNLAKKVKNTGAYEDADLKALVEAVEACDGEEKAPYYRDRAKEKWEREGEIEIDDEAVVSVSSDNGAYVQAWVWVYND